MQNSLKNSGPRNVCHEVKNFDSQAKFGKYSEYCDTWTSQEYFLSWYIRTDDGSCKKKHDRQKELPKDAFNNIKQFHTSSWVMIVIFTI